MVTEIQPKAGYMEYFVRFNNLTTKCFVSVQVTYNYKVWFLGDNINISPEYFLFSIWSKTSCTNWRGLPQEAASITEEKASVTEEAVSLTEGEASLYEDAVSL